MRAYLGPPYTTLALAATIEIIASPEKNSSPTPLFVHLRFDSWLKTHFNSR